MQVTPEAFAQRTMLFEARVEGALGAALTALGWLIFVVVLLVCAVLVLAAVNSRASRRASNAVGAGIGVAMLAMRKGSGERQKTPRASFAAPRRR